MGKLKEFFDGKKSYIVVVGGVILHGCVAMGYIDQATADIITKFLIGAFGLTIRAAIKKAQ